ncbi:MAG: TldD/PmbA family protein, partial [Candidatus Aminicenantes bacterium]|nr:TldD/PmbA family protein [Candidatus Aminicenantes bacterium]
MKKFSVNLIEDNRINIFSIDSKNQTENTFLKRSGVLRRHYDGSWSSSSIELDSMNGAKNWIAKVNLPQSWRKQKESVVFDPGKILRANRYLFDFLESVKGIEWKVNFRMHSMKRLIINNQNSQSNTTFNHFSILVKLKLPSLRNFIEVGEGNTAQLKFNQNGLSLRIKDILDNHRKSKRSSINRKMPVVLSSGDGGIIFHEILGHSLEADYIYQRMSSITKDDIGKKIISENVSLDIDDRNDPFYKNRVYDDEGETAGFSRLVERGVLCNLISDFFYQELLKIRSCGHSRVEDYTKIPMPRMYALYLKPGPYDAEELIESTPYGVYAKEFGDGKIFFNKNLFYFNIKAAYLIEKGRITSPLGNIMVRGNITEILNSVDMIANDFRYDKGISYCIKNGQTLNVRVGQPSVKINNL